MSNRYILDPSGKIIKTSENFDSTITIKRYLDGIVRGSKSNLTITQESQVANESDYYNNEKYSGDETYLGNFKINDTELFGSLDLDAKLSNNILAEKVVKTLTDEKPSFGFIDESGNKTTVQTKQFRQYNNFNVTSDNDGKPLPFINEFEFYTGYKNPLTENLNPGIESLDLLITYFTSVIVEAAIIEGLIVSYKLLSPQTSNTPGENRLDSSKKFLVMGEYILDEVDVFSRYFFDVINYPIEEKSVGVTYFLKRTACYFIGLNEWLSHDRLFSWEDTLSGLGTSLLGKDLSAILEKTIDITLSNFSNAASLKRILLLVKKFNTQRYWVNEQLYKYKSKDYTDNITDLYGYYYFKFFVERVNVGIKIYNRIYADDSIKNLVKSEFKNNRISQDFNDASESNLIDYNNDKDLSSIRRSITDIALSGITGANADKKIEDIKQSLSDAKKKTARYKFQHKFKGMSIQNIPSALMFNKTSASNTALSTKDVKGNYIYKDAMQDFFAKTNENHLPIDLVNEIEKNLESEYMPFYFHDLRTNELLSFHAFIESISDAYSPEYTATSGFGRIDDVRTYVKTTRTISLSFIVAAMNKSDHSTMWYYLNKLVSMVYPQWSKGEELVIDQYTLEQPFSQVPTNSPLIRLRLGDLIKNNYSRFNLSRIFGLDNEKYQYRETIYDDGKEEFDWNRMGIDVNFQKLSLEAFIDGDNTIPYSSSDIETIRPYLYAINNDLNTTVNFDKEISFLLAFDVSVKGNDVEFVDSFILTKSYEATPTALLTDKFIRVVKGMEVNSLRYLKILTQGSPVSDDVYLNDMFNDNYLFLLSDIEKTTIYDIVSNKGDNLLVDKHVINGIMKPFNDDGTINNPITQAYESRMSKGLAGHITSLDFNYSDATWEIDSNSKAPMMVKVTMNFAPIHDIPPGLDEKGMMRAANYNVGKINELMFNSLQKYEQNNK